MALTLAKIEEIAPDQGSIQAARKLLTGRSWPNLASDELGLAWGECQGSGSLPYRVVLSEADLGYKCTCPSRKFPCKHTLALMWMRAEGRSFAKQERPDWVSEWLARRRGPSASTRAAQPSNETRPKISLAGEAQPETTEADPKAEARSAAQRERNRAEREASILSGLDDLDVWIIDQIERGVAGFQSVAHEQCRLAARRLVDAKASSLAARVEQLPAALFGLPEPMRPAFVLEKLGELHLMAEAYRRQSELSPTSRADIRLAVGWMMSREALFTEPLALRVRGRWMVLASVNEVQADKLRRLETWLGRLGEGEAPRFAVLMDFVPVSLGAVGNTYSPGECFEAELIFYPSDAPLRAIVAEQVGGAVKDGRWPAPSAGVAVALAGYEAMLAARPWLGAWPVAVGNAIVGRRGEGLFLSHDGGGIALPIKASGNDEILPLVGVEGVDAFGLWDGRWLDLKFAETPLGRWLAA
ncbi:MAG: SWIM zinc finger family protein [Methylobacteriaceae bacterium]|nr:SWIM zinc finger family protein [Methylobacteriaceae bacterium]